MLPWHTSVQRLSFLSLAAALHGTSGAVSLSWSWRAGINTGVMLFRNTPWSKAFLEELYGYAQLGEEALQEMRQARLPPYTLHAHMH